MKIKIDEKREQFLKSYKCIINFIEIDDTTLLERLIQF